MKDVPNFGNFGAMKKNTSISLGQHFDQFIKNEIESGKYKSASEVVREGLRMLEVKREREIVLKEAIEEGIKNGVSKDFDIESFIDELERK